jgi:limonene-1,2-epoxide hydrolase
VFEVAGDRFTAIREYFDTAPLVAARAAAGVVSG